MIVNLRKDCPHALKHNLMKLEDFNKIAFGNLKCEKCEEKKKFMDLLALWKILLFEIYKWPFY